MHVLELSASALENRDGGLEKWNKGKFPFSPARSLSSALSVKEGMRMRPSSLGNA